MPRLKITETVLRDGQQSLAATLMTTAEMVPILPVLDKVGYHSLEVFGGETFESCLRRLHEDPWQRLRILRANIRNTKLQMLFRGQSMLGYHPYPDDIVQYFIQKSVANGIDIVRVSDPLNDPRNLETAIRAAKKEKAHVQAALCYTTGAAHTNESMVAYIRQLRALGADSICIKDAAGILKPYDAYQLIKAIKAMDNGLTIQLHSHYTAGFAAMTVLKAVETGVDIVDTAISPFAQGNSLPPTETIVSMLQSTPYETELDTYNLAQAAEYFTVLREDYLKRGIIDQRLLRPSATTLHQRIPLQMHFDILTQLETAGKKHLLPDVLKEVLQIREEVGEPPLVTPISRIVGAQAVLNVLTEGRYKMLTDEFRALVAGKYGQTPVPIEPAFQKRILGDELPITYRPADALDPSVEKYRVMVAPYAEQEEDLLTLALFEKAAIAFFEWRKKQKYKLDPRSSVFDATHPV